MRTLHHVLVTVVSAAVAAALFVGATASAWSTGGARPMSSVAQARSTTSPSDYPTNRDGDSFGVLPAAEDQSPAAVSEMPDLVGVIAEDGTPGYARRGDLFPDDAVTLSPEEASKRSMGKRWIDVLAADGTTVIGRLKVWRGLPPGTTRR